MELRIFAEPQEGASYDAQLGMAQAAERHGFCARLLEYADAGAARAYLQVIRLDDIDQVALVAEEVLPRLAGT